MQKIIIQIEVESTEDKIKYLKEWKRINHDRVYDYSLKDYLSYLITPQENFF